MGDEIAQDRNLTEALYAALAAARGKIVIETGEQSLTGAEIVAGALRTAGALMELGVGKGDRVAVQVEKSPQALYLYLACLRLGAIYLPLNTAYRRIEIEYFLGDAAPRLFVCDPAWATEYAPIAERAGAKLLTLGEAGGGDLPELAARAAPGPAVAEIQPDDIAALLYTSGTTGRSKGAMITHRNLLSNARALIDAWSFTSDDVLVHALPIFHIHGLFVALHTTLLSGARMIWLPRFDADAVLACFARATVFMGVPTYYTRLLDDPRLDRTLTRGMRLFVSGSAPLLAETFTRFEQRTGHAILERYGMTETEMIASNPLDGPRVPGTVGHALPGVEVRIADDAGRPLAAGETGMVEVRGPNVFAGYWRMPEKTAAEFRPDGFFITGDVGRLDGAGVLALVGRAKDLIICGGLNVYPKEIEELIDALEGVRECAVIGLPHPDFGEAVAAVVTTEPGPPPSEADIVGRLKGAIANFKVPKAVFFADELPRNAMGKVQKAALRERYGATFSKR